MKLAIFDFDGTLFPEETLPFLLAQWRAQNCSRARLIRTFVSLVPLYVAYKIGLNRRMTKEQMIMRAVEQFGSIFAGMKGDELTQFFTSAVNSMERSFNPEVTREIQKARREGYHIVILSRAYTPLLELVGNRLGIDTVLGTDILILDGMVDPKQSVKVVAGFSKSARLKACFWDKQVDWVNSVAYADSYHDLDVLEMVGRAVAVNPDPELRAVAEERGWRII